MIVFLNKKKIIVIFLIILLIGSYFGFKKIKGQEQKLRYVLTEVEKGTIISTVSGSGQISSLDQADIKSKISGEILNIFVEKGEEVKKGEVLFELDKKDKERALRDAQIALDNAKKNLEKATEEFTNLRKQIEDSLNTAYNNGLTTLDLGFKTLNNIISSLKSIFEECNFEGCKGSDFDYYLYLIGVMEDKTFPYWEEGAEKKFEKFKEEFNSLREQFLLLRKDSSQKEIKNYLDLFYQFSSSFSEFLRQSLNLISEYQKTIEERNITPPISLSITNTQHSLISSAYSTTSNLFSSVEKLKLEIENLEMNSPRQLKNAQMAIEDAQSDLKKKEEAFSDAKESLENCLIYAPFRGVVANLNVKERDTISANSVLATLITKEKIAQISLNEIDAAMVKVGQKATLTFDAVPDLTLTGKVIEIDTVGTVSQGVVSYGVKIILDSDDERIKPSMSVTAEIIIEIKNDVFVLPNSAIKNQGNLKYVELIEASEELKKQLKIGSQITLPKGIQIKNQIIETGLSNDTHTEIISGLKEGDIVISSRASSQTAQTRTTQTQFRFQIPGMGGGLPRR